MLDTQNKHGFIQYWILLFLLFSLKKTLGFFFSELCTPDAVRNKDCAFLLICPYRMKLNSPILIFFASYIQIQYYH